MYKAQITAPPVITRYTIPRRVARRLSSGLATSGLATTRPQPEDYSTRSFCFAPSANDGVNAFQTLRRRHCSGCAMTVLRASAAGPSTVPTPRLECCWSHCFRVQGQSFHLFASVESLRIREVELNRWKFRNSIWFKSRAARSCVTSTCAATGNR